MKQPFLKTTTDFDMKATKQKSYGFSISALRNVSVLRKNRVIILINYGVISIKLLEGVQIYKYLKLFKKIVEVHGGRTHP